MGLDEETLDCDDNILTLLEKYFSPSSPIITFYLDFREFLSSVKEPDEDEILDFEALIFNFWTISSVLFNSGMYDEQINKLIDPEAFLAKYKEYDNNKWIIFADQAQRMYEDLERLKGIISHMSSLPLFKTGEQFDEVESYREGYLDSYPNLMDYIDSNGLTTCFSIVTHFFGQYLDYIGLGKVGVNIQQAFSVQEVVNILLQSDFTSDLATKESEIKQKQRLATLEEKKT